MHDNFRGERWMVRSMAVRSAAPEKGWQRFATKCRRLFNHKWLYLMLLPCLANFVIFHYWPMYGLQIAFKRFNIVLGAGASPWIGLEHFVNFFSSYYFWEVMGNTLRISLLSIVIGFPIPILFASQGVQGEQGRRLHPADHGPLVEQAAQFLFRLQHLEYVAHVYRRGWH